MNSQAALSRKKPTPSSEKQHMRLIERKALRSLWPTCLITEARLLSRSANRNGWHFMLTIAKLFKTVLPKE